jgi:hypothetical protein
MEWLEMSKKTSLLGRLAVISGFGLLLLIFRLSGRESLIFVMFFFGILYWAGGAFAGWYMRRKFAKLSIMATVMAWACLVGFLYPPAGAFAVGASYSFNRFRKDIPKRFVLLPTIGAIATIVLALFTEFALHGRL